MTDTTKIREHMDVVCSCGTRLGAVDRMDGDRIKLTKSDPSAGGRHHWVPMDWVEKIDGNRVLLNKNSEEARADWDEDGEDADQTRGAMTQGQQGGRSQTGGSRAPASQQQDGKASPQGGQGDATKGGATRSRAGADQQGSDTQPRM